MDITSLAEKFVRLVTDNRHNRDLVMVLTSAIDQSGSELGCARLVDLLEQRLARAGPDRRVASRACIEWWDPTHDRWVQITEFMPNDVISYRLQSSNESNRTQRYRVKEEDRG